MDQNDYTQSLVDENVPILLRIWRKQSVQGREKYTPLKKIFLSLIKPEFASWSSYDIISFDSFKSENKPYKNC